MASFNFITIVGYLGRDPELRYTPTGIPVCDFSVATTEKRKDGSGEYKDITTWFRCTAWQKMAERANEYLQKGSPVFIVGPMILREWQDREGTMRTSAEVTVREMKFLGKKGDNDSGDTRRSSRSESQPKKTGDINEDDIPF